MAESTILVLFTVILVTSFFLYISYKETRNIKSISDFLPIKRFMKASEYKSTTVAAGMSLATVMIALINLSPFMGISLFITIITYATGFLALYYAIPKIQKLNFNNDTIPVFLGKQYNSETVKRTSSVFSIIGYSSIFAMELIVGVTIFSPFFSNYALAFAIFFFIFLLTYTLFSGFRGIVRTDIWQLRFIYFSIISLFIFLINSFFNDNLGLSFKEIDTSLFFTWTAPLSFCLGIAVMNIPAALSDIGTWQRVCSTKSASEAKNGLKSALLIFIFIWSSLIILGILYASSGITSKFGFESLPLMEGILKSISVSNSIISLIILFGIISGLLSAMVSTADSLLISAAHTLYDGIILKENKDVFSIGNIRITITILGSISFLIFIVFHILTLNVVQLVFAIYGAQLALFPSTFATLILKSSLKKDILKIGAILSILIGFISAWICAIYGQYSGDANLQFYAPVVSLITSSIIYITVYILSIIKSNEN